MAETTLIPASVGLVASFVACLALRPLLARRLLDAPNQRSAHTVPVPRGGGLGVVLGIVAGAGSAGLLDLSLPWSVVAAVVALAGVGLVDDVRGLGPTVRLIATATVALGLVSILELRDSDWGWMSLLAVLAIVGFVNAFNFMDGIDGISALNAVVVALWLAMHSYDVDKGLNILCFVVASAVVGFVPFNLPSARLFLGDVGSYGLGVALAGCAVLAWSAGVPASVVLAPFVIYLADTGTTLGKRALRRASIVSAHREHAYQRLVDGGLSHPLVASFTAVLTGICCLLALLPTPVTVAGWVATAGVYLLLPTALGRRRQARAVGGPS